MERLSRAAEIFEEKGVDYRIIGSRALALYGLQREFSDIDVLIPRPDIKVVPDVRERLYSDFGRTAVLGTYPAMKVVNFTEEHTSLEYRDIKVCLDGSTMRCNEIDDIKTIYPESLYGFYGTIGIDRSKDKQDKEFLSCISEGEPDPAFDEFKKLRREMYPMYTPTRLLKDVIMRPIPKSLKLVLQDEIEKRVEKKYDV